MMFGVKLFLSRGPLFLFLQSPLPSMSVELVGTFLLEEISEICNKSNVGLYREDILSIFRNKGGTRFEKKKKTYQDYLKNTT